MLAAPIKGDPAVTSENPDRTVRNACLHQCMDEYKGLREHLGLDENSKVLLLLLPREIRSGSLQIVWDGNEM